MRSLALKLGLAFSHLAFSAPTHVHGEAKLENRLSERLALDHGSDDLPGLTHADKPSPSSASWQQPVAIVPA